MVIIRGIVKGIQKIMWNDTGLNGDELLKFMNQTFFPTLSNLDLSTGNKLAFIDVQHETKY